MSASSEEMAAQVADVSEQAEVLARTAAEVRVLLAQFRVDSSAGHAVAVAADPEPAADAPLAEPTVVARRRPADWQPGDRPRRAAGRRAG